MVDPYINSEVILKYIDKLLNESFEGWSKDEIKGYKTALISIEKFIKNETYIMTAETFIVKKLNEQPARIKAEFVKLSGEADNAIFNSMVEFAKHHVEKALFAQAELAKACIVNNAPVPSKEFLASAYPLNKIK